MIVIYHFEAKNSKKKFGPNATSGECTKCKFQFFGMLRYPSRHLYNMQFLACKVCYRMDSFLSTLFCKYKPTCYNRKILNPRLMEILGSTWCYAQTGTQKRWKNCELIYVILIIDFSSCPRFVLFFNNGNLPLKIGIKIKPHSWYHQCSQINTVTGWVSG